MHSPLQEGAIGSWKSPQSNFLGTALVDTGSVAVLVVWPCHFCGSPLSRWFFLGVLCWWDQRGEGLQGSHFISHQEQGTSSRWSSGFSSAENRSGQSHKFQYCSTSFTPHRLPHQTVLAASHVIINYRWGMVRVCANFTVHLCVWGGSNQQRVTLGAP